MATDPTPPVAPVTATGPAEGVSPPFSNAKMQSIAVYPAVPMRAASKADKLAGKGKIQSDLTLAS